MFLNFYDFEHTQTGKVNKPGTPQTTSFRVNSNKNMKDTKDLKGNKPTLSIRTKSPSKNNSPTNRKPNQSEKGIKKTAGQNMKKNESAVELKSQHKKTGLKSETAICKSPRNIQDDEEGQDQIKNKSDKKKRKDITIKKID